MGRLELGHFGNREWKQPRQARGYFYAVYDEQGPRQHNERDGFLFPDYRSRSLGVLNRIEYGGSATHAALHAYRAAQFGLLFPHRRQIRTNAFEQFRRHADRFGQRGMRVYGLADVFRVGAHLYCEAQLADQVAGVGADDARTDQSMRGVVEQQFGEALVA